MPTPTHCPYCALQCAMNLTADGPGVTVSGRQFPTNGGGLCRKGWTSAALLASGERITEPMLRGDDGRFSAVSWEEALERVVYAVRRTQARYGKDAVGVFGSGGLTNEKAYQLGKFARVALGSSMIDYNGRFCMSSAAAASNRAFGVDRGLPFPVTDLAQAHTVLLLGSNVADTMPPFVQHLQAAREAGGLIVVDPRTSATAALTADGAGIHVQPAPGTDLVLLLGLAHVVLHEGLADEAYLAARTRGLRGVTRSVNPWWPERVQSVTGVPAGTIRHVARRLAAGARAGTPGAPRGIYILTGRGVEQHVNGTDTATAAINLALLLGLPGSEHGGYGTLTGQGNGQGGREHGQKADQLPGYRKITDPAARAHLAAVWGVPESSIPGPGLPAVQMLEALGQPGGVRCLLVHGSNIAVSAPDAGAVLESLRRLDFLVVSDFFFSETAAEADLVLPVAQWAEEEGTMTNLEGRVLRRRRAVSPPPGARDELWVLAELAARLNAPSAFSSDPREVFEELRLASAGGAADYSGIDYALLEAGDAAYWPYPAGSIGTPRLFRDSFAHPDGKAVLVPVAASAAKPGQEITLVTGRLLEHYQSGAQTRRVPELAAAQPEARLEIHPVTAAALGVADGDLVEIANGRGRIYGRASHTTGIRQDTVFLPFHFPAGESANRLTAAATDPVSGMPEFKTSTVQLRRWEEARVS
ncbi:molybdopterin oxidoreductase family protein [Paenarthrobacter sp. DKR-5]|uniref:molybdopterin oxidoreductase family protein n=1 Tax=Paenarthrobacter sp. DKR-5 TaxID=2835535 RepID=UPI001BDC56FD|nr:molybdopterin oxidoreductase family protein [Paenarthrobacter sp. DKR-5]MBT1004427.1 molybdopterin oxidoreductase family protein [Paenarthrobacter sp. DKR-5]